MIQGAQTGALQQLEGREGKGDGREIQEGGNTVYLWLILVAV